MEAARWAAKTGKSRFEYYETAMFRNYGRAYAKFIKKWKDRIDLYANLDALPDTTRNKEVLEKTAEISYKNQLWLEKLGIHPIPVVHYLEDFKWFRNYVSRGHEIIGVGIAGAMMGGVRNTKEGVISWLNQIFDFICSNPKRLPAVKVHGFGVTSFEMMTRFPWFSVDSTAWTKRSGYGRIFVPHKRGNKFVFDEEPYCISIACERPRWKRTDRKKQKDWKPIYLDNHHYLHLSKGEKKVIQDWLEKIEVPLGVVKDGKRIEAGVTSSKYKRDEANIRFFLAVQDSIPAWPWRWKLSQNGKGGFFK